MINRLFGITSLFVMLMAGVAQAGDTKAEWSGPNDQGFLRFINKPTGLVLIQFHATGTTQATLVVTGALSAASISSGGISISDLSTSNAAQQVEIDNGATSNLTQQTSIDDLVTSNAAQQVEIDDGATSNLTQQTSIDNLSTSNTAQQAEIDLLQGVTNVHTIIQNVAIGSAFSNAVVVSIAAANTNSTFFMDYSVHGTGTDGAANGQPIAFRSTVIGSAGVGLEAPAVEGDELVFKSLGGTVEISDNFVVQDGTNVTLQLKTDAGTALVDIHVIIRGVFDAVGGP